MNEHRAFSVPGIPWMVVCLLMAGIGIHQITLQPPGAPGVHIVIGVLLVVLAGLMVRGFFQVSPNEGVVMQLFGKFAGTTRQEGLRWTNPFYSRSRVSLRVRNFESSKLKVNDANGNPIEIAAVVVWQVLDTAEAVFRVDNYENFVHIQSESALRQMAQSYPYDAEANAPSLRSHGDVINNHIRDEIQARLEKAGVQVIEARISHLAYAQEIAQVMLQRQQASAVVAARERIVEGAVGIVGMALERLAAQGMVSLDEERKAAMVSNLLVVLCSDRATQPVINTGSLYN